MQTGRTALRTCCSKDHPSRAWLLSIHMNCWESPDRPLLSVMGNRISARHMFRVLLTTESMKRCGASYWSSLSDPRKPGSRERRTSASSTCSPVIGLSFLETHAPSVIYSLSIHHWI